jgi:protein-L-isoaspartate(D-aspartate) O-methyltransferase
MHEKFILIIIPLILLIPSACISKEDKTMNKLCELRELMVKNQIENRGITNERVLDAMRKVERHRFIPGSHVEDAYGDHPVSIGHGQTISQPYIVALMTEHCELSGNEKVLEIGTGSGYQAAILSLLASKVYSIELVESLGKSADQKLKSMNFKVEVKIGDGYKGLPDEAPFDVIILTAAPLKIPEALLKQLSDGGILIAPEGEFIQELVKIKRKDGKYIREIIAAVRFVPMVPGK